MRRIQVKRLLLATALSALMAGGGTAALADTLRQTLVTAYQSSPILESARAQLRQQDEGVAQARAGQRPNVAALAGVDGNTFSNTNYDFTERYSAELQASLNVYDHGVTAAAIESAKAVVAASRAQLRAVEQNVLFDAVTAFMDVRRDTEFVSVANNNVNVLAQQVRATQDRFDLGEVTRTDVSLAEARSAEARANFALTTGDLEVSEQIFREVVGVPPNSLQAPPPLPAIPYTLDEAIAIALREHPSLLAARYFETAAGFDLRRARAARGPSVDLTGSLSAVNTEGVFGGRDENTGLSVGIQGSVPIYQGGQLSSLVRQAEAVQAERKYDVQDTARQIRRAAAAAYSQIEVARAAIAANREQVRAAQVAFDGVQEEARLGARTTLDVLDFEQDLRDAQVQLASSERDEYVAAYGLLSAMGLLSVSFLNLGIPQYDPDLNYNRVQGGPYSTVEGTILDKLRDRYSR